MTAAARQPVSLEIDIVSDVVCPWCVIGYLQLERALASLSGAFTPQIRWQPFELNPHMGEEGQDLGEHIREKYGAGGVQVEALRERLTALGESLGFSFDYSDGMRMVNTFRAHQLLHWAGEQERQTALMLALFEAFFSRREDVNDEQTLVAVARRAGLDAGEARAVLRDGRCGPAVRGAQRRWLEREVHAVPTFFFQDRFTVPGAQDAESFVRVLNRVRDRSSPANP